MEFKIHREDEKIDSERLVQIIKIIKSQNKESIISDLELDDLKKFLKEFLKYKNNFLFTACIEKRIIGYITYSQMNTNFLSNKMKFYFLFCLLKKLKIISILNVFLKITNFDKIFFSNEKKKIYLNSLNLSYLGIEEHFQSKGVGKELIFKTISLINSKNIISVETYNRRAQKFYKHKCNFKKLGTKIQFFKKVSVFIY